MSIVGLEKESWSKDGIDRSTNTAYCGRRWPDRHVDDAAAWAAGAGVPQEPLRHQDIATSTYGSPQGDVAVGSPKNLRQRQLILTPLVQFQRADCDLVRDYNCGEIARAELGIRKAYALRNRHALPATSRIDPASCEARRPRGVWDERPRSLSRFAQSSPRS